MNNTRYLVDYDIDARFEECNGEPRPLTAEEYKGNEYRACPDHMRAGTKVISFGPPQIQGCKTCENTNYVDIPYEEYLAYYGNPNRHVFLYIQRQDRCPYCGDWHDGDALYGIDFMDSDIEAHTRGRFTLEQLPTGLKEIATDLAAFEPIKE